MRLKLLLLFGGIAFYTSSFSQKIKGLIVNKSGTPIERATIVATSTKNVDFIIYMISNKDGRFFFNVSNLADSLRIEVSCLGFERKTIIVPCNIKALLNITLDTSSTMLSDVVIKQNFLPISNKRDTINYNVHAFADSSDREIIDIIRKLPGISVTPNGQILFNNKAINKFYIEGQDLLEDRYNIASNNLPAKDVETIQILPDHQPIAVLSGKVPSDRAAINIKLNKYARAKLLGTLSANLGLPLKNRDLDFALLKFKSSVQSINILKSNSTGVDLDNEITSHTDGSDQLLNNSIKQNVVSIPLPSYPQLDNSRYLFNNTNLFTSNYLFKVGNFFNFKINNSLENNIVTSSPYVTTKLFLPNDTIKIVENHSDIKNYSIILSSITLEGNKKDLYFRESLAFQQIWNKETDEIPLYPISQSLKAPIFNLQNSLKGIIKIGNDLVNFTSFFTFGKMPQSLQVSPGQFQDTINNGNSFEKLLQNYQSRNLYTNNSIAYEKSFKNFFLTNSIGSLYKSEDISNTLVKVVNGVLTYVGYNYSDTIKRKVLKIYDNLNVRYLNNDFETSFDIRSNYNFLSTKSPKTSQVFSGIFLNPELDVKYKITNYFDNSINISIDNVQSNNTNVSYLLTDYRDLISNNTPIVKTRNYTASYNLNYRDVIRGIFSNLDLIYTRANTNILEYTSYNGFLTVSNFIPKKTPSETISANLKIDKYYSDIKTGFSLQVNYSYFNVQEIQQSILRNLLTEDYILKFTTMTNPVGFFSIVHSITFSSFESKAIQNNVSTVYSPISVINQRLSGKIFLPFNLQIILTEEQYYLSIQKSSTNSSFFSDVKFLKRFMKNKLDITTSLTNILDNKQYTNYSYSNNMLINSTFPLRGRTFLMGISYQF